MITKIFGKDEEVEKVAIWDRKSLYVRKQEGGKRKWVKVGSLESSPYRDLLYIKWNVDKKELFQIVEYTRR